jgi:hypothetical protein
MLAGGSATTARVLAAIDGGRPSEGLGPGTLAAGA